MVADGESSPLFQLLGIRNYFHHGYDDRLWYLRAIYGTYALQQSEGNVFVLCPNRIQPCRVCF